MSPSIIRPTGEQKRPDIVIIDKQRSWVFVLELTVGFETRIKDNAVCKHNHYSGLCSEQRNQYNRVKYDACDVTLSVYPHRARLKNMPGQGGNRTYDLWKTSPMLCQLSYAVRSVRVCDISFDIIAI